MNPNMDPMEIMIERVLDASENKTRKHTLFFFTRI